MPSATRRAIAGLVLLSGVITAGIVVSPTATVALAEQVAGDPLLFGLLIGGLYLVRPLFAWPTTPMAVLVGYGFGITVGIPVAVAGVIVTVIPVFLVVGWLVRSDTSSGETATREDGVTESLRVAGFGGAIGGLFDRTEHAIDRYYETAGPLRGVVASRLAPIHSDISTAAAAIGGVRLHHFVVGTLVGELPWTIAGVVIGASAATATTEGLGELGLALTVACTIAAGLLLAGPLYRHLQTRQRSVDRSSADG